MIIRYAPRWLHDEVIVPASGTVYLPSSVFANTEVYPWHLHWLSVVGIPDTTGMEAPWDTAAGGVGRRLRFEVGISQWGDINLVPANTLSMFAQESPMVQSDNLMNPGVHFGFTRPFPLAPDAGMVCEVQNLNASEVTVKASILFTGFHRVHEDGQARRRPAMLAGTAEEYLQAGGSQDMLDRADLLNNGRDTLYIQDMIMDGMEGLLDLETFYPALDQLAWRINPSTGIPWMPRPRPIPVGCIAPHNRAEAGWLDEGPKAYEFPEDTILQPRQRLGIKITELSGVAQTLHVCLHGLLEVS
jgi:hypothetical protein